MTQGKMGKKETRLLDYLNEFGGVTSIDAIRDLGDTRLSATIFNLRKLGVDIQDTWHDMRNRYGETVKFKFYFLPEKAEIVRSKRKQKSSSKDSKIIINA